MKLKMLGCICDILQLGGIVLVLLKISPIQLPAFAPVLFGIVGFSFIVESCLPSPYIENAEGMEKIWRRIGLFIGPGIIIWACTM